MVACKKLSIHLLWKWQIPADSVGSGSILNYNCFMFCSWFFTKIIFKYTSIYFITDTPRVSQDPVPRYERSCRQFWPLFEIVINKFKKTENNRKLSHCVILCDMVSRKNYKLGIIQIYWKCVIRNELSCMKIHVFQAKWPLLWPRSLYSLLK